MRFFRKTLAWIIVLMALAGLSYFFEEKVSHMEAEEAAKRRLFTIEPSDVTSVEIARGDEILAVKKGNDGWFIEKPLIASADQKAIEDMLMHTLRANIDGVLYDEAPADKLKEMGLEPPYLTATIKSASRGTVSIDLGDRGPTQNVTFAIFHGEKRILRVHADVRSELDKTIYDFRDKTVIAIDPQKLKKAEIIWKGREKITIYHPQNNIWDVEGIPQGETDMTKLLGTLYGVKEAQIKAFTDDNPKNLKAYGLEEPRIKFRFIDDKNLQQNLFVGDKDKKLRGFYAKRSGDPNVFLLEEDFIDNIPESARDLKMKVD